MTKSTPSSHDITINPTGGKDFWWPPGCPAGRHMPRTAKEIGSIVWCSGAPGLSWPEAYYVASNRARSHYILWGEADPGDYGTTDARVPLAWRPRADLPIKDVARSLLLAYWHSQANSEIEIFEHATSGLLSCDELWFLAYEVWPELPVGIAYCDAFCEALHICLFDCRCFFWTNELAAEIERPGRPTIGLTNLSSYRDVDGELCIEATDGSSNQWRLELPHTAKVLSPG
jgi:hypothetical protein